MSLFNKKPTDPGPTYAERKAAAKAAGTATKPKRMPLGEELKAVKGTKQERKQLRKDLRKQGVKRRSDFEIFAGEVGLSYPENTLHYTAAKWGARLSAFFGTAFASMTVAKLLIAALAVLALVLYIAYITEERGHFTVNVTADMLEEGFQISSEPNFEDDNTRLFAQQLQNSNATSLYVINRNVGFVDGAHNGPGYMAYTFYLRNNGTETTDYAYTVNILSETLNTAAATWVMFFEGDYDPEAAAAAEAEGREYRPDTRQVIYAEAQADGKPENLFGYKLPPFIETAYYNDIPEWTDDFDPSAQFAMPEYDENGELYEPAPRVQYYKDDGMYGVITTPFIDEFTALQGYVSHFEPGQIKMYTAVVWLEGDDPDCNNSILGGHVGFNVQFDRLGEDDTSFFKGLFRLEYNKSYYALNPPDADTGYAGSGEWADMDIPGAGY